MADMFATKAALKLHAQFTAAYSFVNNDSENKKLDNIALQHCKGRTSPYKIRN